MNDKELLKLLGLTDRTITFGLEEDLQIAIERKIDNYLKKLDDEKKQKESIDFYKKSYEDFKKKDEYIKTFKDNFVYGKIKDKLIRDGFIYRCPFCLDLSGQYGKPLKSYNHNHN